MKNEKLFRAIGGVGDDLILRAEAPMKKRNVWGKWAALAACFCLLIGAAVYVLPNMGTKSAAPVETQSRAAVAQDSVTEEAAVEENALPESAPAMEAPAGAAPEAPAEEPMSDLQNETMQAEPPAAAPGENEIFFDGKYYAPAPDNDGGHPAEEKGDGALKGQLRGTVQDAYDPALIGAEVFGYPLDGYILVLDPRFQHEHYVLYRVSLKE